MLPDVRDWSGKPPSPESSMRCFPEDMSSRLLVTAFAERFMLTARMETSPMPRADALVRLPALYSLALRLREAGLSDDLLVECLGIEPEALGALLEIAEAKLRAMESGEPPG
jgi:hypothetical protein